MAFGVNIEVEYNPFFNGVLSYREFDIYVDVDNFLNPIVTNMTIEPYTSYSISVPDNTTIVKLYDIENGCFIDMSITQGDICDFSFRPSSINPSVGKIEVGRLFREENQMSDYVINWVNENGDVVYVSGDGTLYEYSFKHPLSGSSAIIAEPGIYTPVIYKLNVNGVDYSSDSNLNGFTYMDFSSCLESQKILAEAFSCENTSNRDSLYTHNVSFVAESNNIPPDDLSSQFILTSDIKYFCWSFRGFFIEDEIKLTFYGSSYTDPIGLEWWIVGNDINASDYVTLPNKIKTNIDFKKMTSLKNITVNDGDYIKIEVISNKNNNLTNWDLSMKCLNEDPLLDGTCLNDTEYVLDRDSLNLITPSVNCLGAYSLDLGFVSCNNNDGIETITNYSDGLEARIIRYNSTITANFEDYYSVRMQFTQDFVSCIRDYVLGNLTCVNINPYSITKIGSQFKIIFSDNSDYLNYFQLLQDKFSAYDTNYTPSDMGYYASIRINYVNKSQKDSLCGDSNLSYRSFAIHPTSNLVGDSVNNTIIIDLVTITPPVGLDECMNCYIAIESTYNQINDFYNSGDMVGFDYSNGIYMIDPFYYQTYFDTNVTEGKKREDWGIRFEMNELLKTKPFDINTNQLLPAYEDNSLFDFFDYNIESSYSPIIGDRRFNYKPLYIVITQDYIVYDIRYKYYDDTSSSFVEFKIAEYDSLSDTLSIEPNMEIYFN